MMERFDSDMGRNFDDKPNIRVVNTNKNNYERLLQYSEEEEEESLQYIDESALTPAQRQEV